MRILWVKESGSRYPYYFLLLYALSYMGNASYNTFIPVYLDQLGFSRTSVGTLLAIGPVVAILANPVWGLASDRAKSKNGILKIVVLCSAAAILLYPLSANFIYLFAVIAVFNFFQSSINPLSDAITLEQLEAGRWKFGPIRMAGTLGFAVMSVGAGIIARQNIAGIFAVYFCTAIFTFLSVCRLPVVRGHQAEGRRTSPWLLLKNRGLVLLLAFNFIIQVTFGFYYSFFPIYYKQLGASTALLGVAMFITSTSEIPFLLFADRILERFGIRLVLCASALIISVRWLLLHLITDVNALLAVNSTHGLSFIVFAFCMATYINRNVPRELRASGQTLNALLCMGLARMLGSVAGGLLSDYLGIRQVFLCTSLVSFSTILVIGSIFLFQRYRGQNRDSGEAAGPED